MIRYAFYILLVVLEVTAQPRYYHVAELASKRGTATATSGRGSSSAQNPLGHSLSASGYRGAASGTSISGFAKGSSQYGNSASSSLFGTAAGSTGLGSSGSRTIFGHQGQVSSLAGGASSITTGLGSSENYNFNEYPMRFGRIGWPHRNLNTFMSNLGSDYSNGEIRQGEPYMSIIGYPYNAKPLLLNGYTNNLNPFEISRVAQTYRAEPRHLSQLRYLNMLQTGIDESQAFKNIPTFAIDRHTLGSLERGEATASSGEGVSIALGALGGSTSASDVGGAGSGTSGSGSASGLTSYGSFPNDNYFVLDSLSPYKTFRRGSLSSNLIDGTGGSAAIAVDGGSAVGASDTGGGSALAPGVTALSGKRGSSSAVGSKGAAASAGGISASAARPSHKKGRKAEAEEPSDRMYFPDNYSIKKPTRVY